MTCLVYTVAFSERWHADAQQGGPQGEMLVAESLAFGLERLGYRVVRAGSLRAFARATRLGVARRRFDFSFFDPPTLQDARRYRLVRAAQRSFVLEWFGTAPHMVNPRVRGLTAARYLTPYPYTYGWNTFLGFILHHRSGPAVTNETALRERVRSSLRRKKRQGVIWGKEGRCLAERGELLAKLAAICPLHATVDPRRAPPNGLPCGVINHGALSRAAWRELLSESNFVIGVGDPISGPTALEALAEGCVYLNPAYEPPRHVYGVAALPVRSQHPYAAGLGAPFVRTMDITDSAAVIDAAETSLHPVMQGEPCERLIEHLAPFTEARYCERLRGILEAFG
jgi:hypothetical protein